MAYSIADNGTLPMLSRLEENFEIDDVFKLPLPNGKTYREAKKGEDGIRVTLAELNEVTQMLQGKELSIKNWNIPLFSEDQLRSNSSFVLESFLRILNSDKTTIIFEEPKFEIPDFGLGFKSIRYSKEFGKQYNDEQKRIFDSAKKEFLTLLKKHSLSDINKNREAALRNNVVNRALSITLAPVNQINAHSPINMDEVNEVANNSLLSNAEKHISSDIPSSKFKMQEQAMVGKDVTGISAVSVKVFFSETTYFNKMLEEIADLIISGQSKEGLDLLSNLVMKDPLKVDRINGRDYYRPLLLANTNVKRIIKRLGNRKFLEGVHPEKNSILARPDFDTPAGFNIYGCLQYLNREASKIDAALSESGILSSSTDNMKELTLPKLNATPELVDIYTSLISSGISLNEVADILTSPLFIAAGKLAKNNIFRESTNGFNISKALNFYLNRDVLPHVRKKYMKMVLEAATEIEIKYDDLLKYVEGIESNSNIEKALNILYSLRSSIFSNKNDELEQYFDGTYDMYSDTDSLSDMTLSEINTLINYFEECINRNETIYWVNGKSNSPEYERYGNAEVQLNQLALILDNVIPKTEEQRIYGQMLGINQGIKTDAYEVYSLVRRIENFINKRIGTNVTDESGKIIQFNLYEFLKPNNNSYKAKWINAYDSVKSSFNILRAITSVPHFNAMFDVLYVNNWLLSNFSTKYRVVNEVAKEIERRNPYVQGELFDRVLSEREYSQIEHYVNDLFIIGWLSKQNLSITIPAGNIKYEANGTSSVVNAAITHPIKNIEDFATFKNWMETFVIPFLQSDIKPFQEDPNKSFSNNYFISSLELIAVKDKKTNKVSQFYRMPLNMMQIDGSVKTIQIYDNLLKSFDEISSKTLPSTNWKIADLFFIYNLIVNKDSWGINSFTRLFENLVSMKRGSDLVNNFYKFISDTDKQAAKIGDEMINGITSSSAIDDIINYIALNVTNTSIKKTPGATFSNYPSDFTFWVPELAKNWKVVHKNVLPFKFESKDIYKITLDKSTLRGALIAHLESLYGGKVEAHNQQWFKENFKDDVLAIQNPAFFSDGILYIKTDSADLVPATIHEISHMILASMRWSNDENIKNTYYQLLNSIDLNDFNGEISESAYEYYSKTRVGVDLKEELLAKRLEAYFMKDILPKNWESGEILESKSNDLLAALNSILGTRINTKEEFYSVMKNIDSNLEDVLRAFTSTIIDFDWSIDLQSQYMIKTQRVAHIKNMLRNNNLLEEVNCN